MAETDLISLTWPDDERSSVRAPYDLKKNVDDLLKEIALVTKVDMSRNDFIMRSIYFYYRHLATAQTPEDLIKRLEM